MKKPRLWYPHYVRDFRAKTSHLSLAEKGAYRALMDEYWERQGPLPADDELLRRIIGATPKEYRRIRGNVLPYFEVIGNTLVHHRIEEEISKARSTTEAKSLRLAEARKKRWAKKDGEGDQTSDQITDLKSDQITTLPLPSPSPSPSHKNEELKNTQSAREAQTPDRLIEQVLAEWAQLEVEVGWSDGRSPPTCSPGDLAAIVRLEQSYGPDAWRRAMANIRGSPFYRGEEGQWSGARLGWCLKADNFVKLLRNDHGPARKQTSTDRTREAIARAVLAARD